MKKLESTSRKETPEAELKRLREEIKSLKSELKKSGKQHEQTKGKLKKAKDNLKQTKAELKKKRRHDDNLDQRAERITFDAVPGHRYSLLVIKLCILMAC